MINFFLSSRHFLFKLIRALLSRYTSKQTMDLLRKDGFNPNNFRYQTSSIKPYLRGIILAVSVKWPTTASASVVVMKVW